MSLTTSGDSTSMASLNVVLCCHLVLLSCVGVCRTFGPVEDVRIPCQQKRMFGFVTFDSSDTVKKILEMGGPHNVCGARVLVKPYREKPRTADR